MGYVFDTERGTDLAQAMLQDNLNEYEPLNPGSDLGNRFTGNPEFVANDAGSSSGARLYGQFLRGCDGTGAIGW